MTTTRSPSSRWTSRRTSRPVPPRRSQGAGEETDEEEEEEPDDEDVEASLDTILKERLVVEEVEDDEETPEPEDRSGDGVERVLPKQRASSCAGPASS